MGRPSIRTPEMVARYLEAVADGTPGYEVSKLEGMPAWGTWCDWIEKDEELAGKYERARARGMAAEEAEFLREARRQPQDSVDAAKQRTHVQALQWHLSKRLPREFGDKQQVEHSGGVTLQVVTGVPDVTGNAE